MMNSPADVFQERTRAFLYKLLLFLGGLAILILAAAVAIPLIVDAEFLSQRLSRATHGQYRIKIGTLDLNLLRRSVTAENITVVPDSANGSSSKSKTSSRFTADIPALHLTNISYWALIWKGGLSVDSVGISRPHVTIAAGSSSNSTATDSLQSPTTSSSSNQLHSRLAQALPYLSANQITLTNGTVIRKRRNAQKPFSDRIKGLTLYFEHLRVDSVAAADSSRVLFSKNIRFSVDSYTHYSSDSLYQFKIKQLQGATQQQRLSMDLLRLAPPMDDTAFVKRLDTRKARYRVSSGPIELEALNYRRLVEQRAFLTERVVVDSLQIDIFLDKHVPKRRPSQPPMPQDLFQQVKQTIRVDTLNVPYGRISYSAYAPQAQKPGTITFQDISGSVVNITNIPDRMSRETPAVIHGSTLIAGAGRLYATIELPLLAPSLSFKYQGQVGPMHVEAFNNILLPVTKLKLEGGAVDTLWFNATVEQGTARGFLHALYRNLTIRFTGQSDDVHTLPQSLKTFFANKVVVESSNIPSNDDSLRVGTIQHSRQKGTPFFGFIWKSLRSGIYSILGL